MKNLIPYTLFIFVLTSSCQKEKTNSSTIEYTIVGKETISVSEKVGIVREAYNGEGLRFANDNLPALHVTTNDQADGNYDISDNSNIVELYMEQGKKAAKGYAGNVTISNFKDFEHYDGAFDVMLIEKEAPFDTLAVQGNFTIKVE